MSKEITAALVKELRDRTGVGMTKCKEALEATKGDIEEAISFLRKAGVANAVKKSGREAKEGKIAFAENGKVVAIVEVAAETDFVANNERFLKFLNDVAEEVVKTTPSSVEALMMQKFSKDPSMTIEEYRGTVVQAIGENIQVKRIKTFTKTPHTSFGIYSHLGGKILTAVEMEGSDGASAIAKEIAMHAAASSPEYLAPEKIPSDVIAKEKEVASAQVAASGKPQNIVDKIVEGKLNAFYDQSCLLRQKFIKDDSITVKQFVEQKAKETGKPLQVTSFIRWSVGEA